MNITEITNNKVIYLYVTMRWASFVHKIISAY